MQQIWWLCANERARESTIVFVLPGSGLDTHLGKKQPNLIPNIKIFWGQPCGPTLKIQGGPREGGLISRTPLKLFRFKVFSSQYWRQIPNQGCWRSAHTGNGQRLLHHIAQISLMV